MIIYGLKSCDTCRKARKAFPDAAFQDVSEVPVPQEVLRQAESAFGAQIINTRSTTWRGMSDADRSLSPIEMIASHPKVMKRPLTVVDNRIFLGWPKGIEDDLKNLLQD